MKLKTQTERQKGVVALIFLALIFASMGLFARYLSTGLLLFQQVYLRVLAGLVFGFIIFNKDLHFSKLKKISFREWGLLIFRSAANYVFGVTLFTQAILISKYSNVSFIQAVPLTAVFGIILCKERLTSKKLLLILGAFIGMLLVSITDYSNIFSWGKGEIITLLSAVSFALTYVSRKWHSPLLNNKEITQIIFFISFVMLFTFSIVKGDGLPVTGWSTGLLLAVLAAGLFNTANMFLANYGFQKVEAILASNILTLESLFAVILGFLFYQELPMFKELIGGIIIVASVIGMNKLENTER